MPTNPDGRPRRSSRPALSLESLESRTLMAAGPGPRGTAAAALVGRFDPSSEIASPRAGGRLSPDVVRRLDAELDRLVAEEGLPGAAVGIWIPGSGRYLAVRGDADLATGRPRNLADPFRIASVTKTFTATAVLQLADRGRLSTSDPLSKWYPDFPNAASITVDDLLRMRSGIPDSLNAALLEEYYADPRIRITPEQSIARAAARVDEFRPAGVETVYNNLNYIFLQEIVRKVSGRDLGAQIRGAILRPLGLKQTAYPAGDFLPGPLRGYSLDPATGSLVDKTVLNPGVAGGAGAIVSTLRDLAVYARALGTGSLLRPETQKIRLEGSTISGAPDFVTYGQGIEKLGPFIGHNGTIFGFSTEMYYLPALKAVIVVNVNRLDLDDVSRSTPLFVGLSKIAFPDYVLW